MNKLEEILKDKFPDTKIVKLKEYTYKIAGISKVRYGDNRSDSDYDEISLNNIDEYGVIYIPKDSKESSPANPVALINQSLQPGDLIILHRGKIGKMGIVGDKYKRRIVGNNSMIRIQFKSKRLVDTPWFVMQYLQLPYVKEYINTYIPSSGSSKRKILNPEVLAELPIPLFQESNGAYRELLFKRKELSIEVDTFQKNLEKLRKTYQRFQESSVNLALGDTQYLEKSASEEEVEIDEIFKMNNQLVKLLHDNTEKLEREESLLG